MLTTLRRRTGSDVGSLPLSAGQDVAASTALNAVGPLLVLLLVGLGLAVSLSLTSTLPFSDSGGYEGMLRYFLQSGRVDYMKWSQPTFIGVLPLAVPWSQVWGANSASLQWLCVAFTATLLVMIWAWGARAGRAWAAVWLALGVLLLPDALKAATTFLTDIPYVAYMVGFLTAHAQLERAYAQDSVQTRSRAAWWLCWGVCFALSALTRSFSLLLVAVFLAQWIIARRNVSLRGFALRCLLGGGVLALGCLLLTRKLGENAIGLKEITTLPLILKGDRGALHAREFIVSFLELALAVFPALLLWSAPRKWGHRVLSWRIMPWDAVLSGLAVGLGLVFWRKDAFGGLFALPQAPQLGRWFALAQVVLLPFAVPLLLRVLRRGVRTAWELKQRVATSDVTASETQEAFSLPHTSGVLTAIVLVHFALMPFLLHPLPRHLMPAGVALLLLAAVQSRKGHWKAEARPSVKRSAPVVGWREMATSVLTLVLLASIWLGVRATRALDATAYTEAARLADDLQKQGVPATRVVSQVAGGWTWFCARDLLPGQPAGDYVQRYASRRENAPYIVWIPVMEAIEAPNETLPPRAKLVRAIPVAAAGNQRVEVYIQTLATAKHP